MIARQLTKGRLVDGLWWAGALISVVLLVIPYLSGTLDLSRRSPFDNTGSGHAKQWIFLREASEHIPFGSSFTVLAEDRDTEMSLFMISVGLLPEALPLPSSYYGLATEAGDQARFVLDFDNHSDPRPGEILVTKLTGGRLVERCGHQP